jgi:hypothetical protein
MPSIGNVARMVLAPQSMPGSGMQARPARVPEAGFETHAQEVAALERQYYARVLAEMRAENWRAANYRVRPVQGGG